MKRNKLLIMPALVVFAVLAMLMTGGGYNDHLGLGGSPSLTFHVKPADTTGIDTMLTNYGGCAVTMTGVDTVGLGASAGRWIGNVIWLSADKLTARVQVRGLFRDVYYDTAGIAAAPTLYAVNLKVKTNGSGGLKTALTSAADFNGHVVKLDSSSLRITVWK